LEETRSKPNELVKFLEGTWITTDITITPSHEIKTAEYKEIMKIRDPETITITALGIDDGKDVTKDTIIRMNGDEVIMSQGNFSARGIKKGNSASFRGTYQDRVFDFRLYFLEDKYIYQKDVWQNNKVIEIQMSYLLRPSKQQKQKQKDAVSPTK
jgi:hypothetical protein